MSGAQLNGGFCMLNIGAEGFCQCAVKPRYFITSLLLCKDEMKKEKKPSAAVKNGSLLLHTQAT